MELVPAHMNGNNMELLLEDAIGNILSHVGSAWEVVIASGTCKKWKKAWHNHLPPVIDFLNCDISYK